MHTPCHCDKPEGNLCAACEVEVKEVKAEVAASADGWWPRVAVTQRRSINSITGVLPDGFMYV